MDRSEGVNKMNDNFKFYYDESQHSRKINKATVLDQKYHDNFFTAIVGGKENDDPLLKKKYEAFENKYDSRKSKGELKSKTFKPKDFAYGFASLKKDSLQLLNDYFNFFDDKIYFCFSITSKIEYIINQIFKDYHSNIFVDVESMKYSIIKSILIYQPKEIIDTLYDNTEDLINSLVKFYATRIKENQKNLSLKQRENQIFSQIILLLNDINQSFKMEWNYDMAFQGFILYLTEKGIVDYHLFLDKEGKYGNTVCAAQNTGIKNVQEIDSKSNFGIRVSDMFAGILAKLSVSMYNSIKYNNESEFLNKKLLNGRWFELNQEKFELYKKFRKVLLDINNSFYKSYVGIYADGLLCVLNFIYYISDYDTLEEFNKIKISDHRERFNSYMCQVLDKYYLRLASKLPIEPIERNNEEFYFNQRGAKVYFDISKQPMLEIDENPIIYNVLSVGFFKEKIPNITIDKNGKKICYRIPKELFEWAFDCVACANLGENLFPSKVMFIKSNGKYYATIQ